MKRPVMKQKVLGKHKTKKHDSGRDNPKVGQGMMLARDQYVELLKHLAQAGVLYKCLLNSPTINIPNDPVVLDVYQGFINAKNTKRRS